MKRKIYVIILCCIIVSLIGGCSKGVEDDNKYPRGGRDTVAEFGDRRFVILSGYNSFFQPGDKKVYILYDYKRDQTIIKNVYQFLDIKPYVYVYSIKGYVVINYETGVIIKEKLFEKLPKKHQIVFSDNSKFTFLK